MKIPQAEFRQTKVLPIQVDLNGKGEQNIQDKIPTQIKWIYGISSVVNGVTPNNQPLIVSGMEDNLYLSLKKDSDFFIENIRFSELIYHPESARKYLPVCISDQMSLDTSKIINPTRITDYSVLFFLWYYPHTLDEDLTAWAKANQTRVEFIL